MSSDQFKPSSDWRACADIFHDKAAEYDQWFEGSLLFEIELAAVKAVRTPLPGPKGEIGVGPGRFGAALGVDFGLDPALGPLKIAGRRGLACCRGLGEELPLTGNCLGTVYLLFTLCFVRTPRLLLAEIYRVLKPGGILVLGMVNGASPWGKLLQEKKEAGNPYYLHATFYDPEQVGNWLKGAGFAVEETLSTLGQQPEELRGFEAPQPGGDAKAGFLVLVASRPED